MGDPGAGDQISKTRAQSSGSLSSCASSRKSPRRQNGLTGALLVHLEAKIPFLGKLLLETCLQVLWFGQVS